MTSAYGSTDSNVKNGVSPWTIKNNINIHYPLIDNERSGTGATSFTSHSISTSSSSSSSGPSATVLTFKCGPVPCAAISCECEQFS